MLYCCITPERERKTWRIMTALSVGFPDAKIVRGEPPRSDEPFAVWGQAWLTLRILPQAVKQNRPFWHVDNGFIRPARGTQNGYYRLTYRSLSPILLNDPPPMRHYLRDIELKPWRRGGKHILLAMPGPDFGRALGLDMRRWMATAPYKLREITKRPIIVRYKRDPRPLAEQLRGAWAVVTHSSNVAVDAVLAGIPVFVAPTSPAAPVGRTDLDLENPITPDREQWLASLMAQQFTLDEMRFGVAAPLMRAIQQQVGD